MADLAPRVVGLFPRMFGNQRKTVADSLIEL
jgi:hypothetical protein